VVAAWMMSWEAVAFAFCFQIGNLDDFVTSAYMIQRESESKVINKFHETPLRIPPLEGNTLQTNGEL
jgi:hypothetical protein